MSSLSARSFGELIDRSKSAVIRAFIDRSRERIPADHLVPADEVRDHLGDVLDEVIEYLTTGGHPVDAARWERAANAHGLKRARQPDFTLPDLEHEYRLLHEILIDLLPAGHLLERDASRLFTDIVLTSSNRGVETYVRNSAAELVQHRRERHAAERQIGSLQLQRDAIEVERANFENFFREMPELVAIFEGADHHVDFANRAFERVLRVTADRTRFREILPDAEGLAERLDDVFASGETRGVSELKLSIRGRPRYFSFTFSARRDAADRVVGVMALGFDVTASVVSRDSDRLQQQALELALSEAPLAEVLDHLVRMVETQAGEGLLASILLADPDGRRLRHGAAPNLPDAYNDAIDGLEIGPDVGSCGAAAFTKSRAIAEDVNEDAAWAAYRGLAADHDLRACWSTPILNGSGDLLGTFAFYARVPRGPTARELRIIDIATRTTALIIANRNAAERALVTSRRAQTAERMLQKAVDVAKIGFFDWDMKTDVFVVSDQFTRDWGIETGARADDLFAMILPEDLESTRKIIAQAAADGLTHLAQYRVRRPDGTVIWIEAQGRVTMDEFGRPHRFFGTSVDVTARKESESETLAMVNSIPQLAWMANARGHLYWYNQRWQDFTGADQAEMARIGWAPFHHEDHLERASKKWFDHLARGERWEDIFPLRSRTGEWRTFLSQAEPIRDLQGRIVRWFGTNTDVTEPLRAKRNLAQLAAVVESSADFIALADEGFNLVFLNQAGRAMVGMGDRDVKRLRLVDFVSVEERPGVEAQVIPALLADRMWQGELNFRHLETSALIPVNYNVFPIKDTETGELLGYATVTRDITERREFEQNLRRAKDDAEQANHAKSAFLANMSHEIRTPLGAIMGFADLAQQPEVSVDEVRNYLGIVERNSVQVLRIIDDILDLAKVEAGRVDFERIEFALPDFLADFASLMGFRARENGIHFQVTADSDLPAAIISDPTRLRQILTNAVGNAIKFTTKGSVTLHVSADGNEMIFRIVDTGRGISPAQMSQLFQPFAQADASTTRKFGGTGLGLVLTRRLCELMGGDYVLEKSELDVGSTFAARLRVDLPSTVKVISRAEIAFKTAAHAKPESGTRRLEGLSVLLVEDSADNQFLIRLLLERQGATVEIEGDGLSGAERALRENFDVVLMDIQMPVMDGHEAVRKLRAEGYRGPVIALTAHAMKEEAERTHQSGFTNLLTKPIHREALFALVGAYAKH